MNKLNAKTMNRITANNDHSIMPVRERRNVLVRHSINPYKAVEKPRSVVIFEPDEYAQSRLWALSAPALRVWLYLAANLQPDGSSSGTLADMRRRTGAPISTLSRAATELAKMGLIQKKKQSQYWMESRVCRVLTLHTEQI